MLSRRQFLATAAASAGMVAAARRALAAQASRYDLILRGGRVVDPSVRLDAIRDVAISAGRIVAVEPSIAGDAADIIDARGKLVVPGLIDIHTHVARGADGQRFVLQDGVTGWIDAGSLGADRIAARASLVRADMFSEPSTRPPDWRDHSGARIPGRSARAIFRHRRFPPAES